MAIEVYDLTDKQKVDAKTLPQYCKNHDFQCLTDGCEARLYSYDIGGLRARFVSYNKFDHISTACIASELEYNPHSYAQHLFDLDKFINNLCSQHDVLNHAPVNHEMRNGIIRIHNRHQTAISTLGELYSQCCVTGLGNYYNGYLIDDIFASRDNYAVKSLGFTGFHVVETSFYKYIPYTSQMDFNYTPFGLITTTPVHVRISFSSADIAYKYYCRHFMDKTTKKAKAGIHRNLIVIGGVWEASNLSDCIAVCNIASQRQIKFID